MYTLLTLLRAGAIDGNFNPSSKAARRARRGRAPLSSKRQIEKSMLQALSTMLGDDWSKAYLQTPVAEKNQFLIGAFVTRLTYEMNLAGASQHSIQSIAGPQGSS